MVYKATDLRKDIYKILDQILETGQAVEVERNGKRLRIVLADAAAPTERLRPIPGLIAGDPADLDQIDWSGEWKP